MLAHQYQEPKSLNGVVARRMSESFPGVRAPYALLENSYGYFILVKMPGVDRRDIMVEMNEKTRELTVSARVPGSLEDRHDYWVFAIPRTGRMSHASMRLQNGVLEVSVPKTKMVEAA